MPARFLALLTIGCLCLGAACPGERNVKACEEWKQRMSTKKCGETAFPTSIKCESYEELDCDITAFFTCLEENAKCKTLLGTETTDTSGQAQCTSLASCQ